MLTTPITASMLYDLIQCPHRVEMDSLGDISKQDKVNPFVQLLWEKGTLYEKEVIAKLNIPYLDLSHYAGEEKERQTLAAMERGEPLIYGGRISVDDLLGQPDLLRKESNGYIAGDIKAGAGLEGAEEEDDGKPKKHYAVQLALYTDILERKGRSASRRPFIWDVHGEEVVYDLEEMQGVRNPTSLWTTYQKALTQARQIVSNTFQTLPAYCAACKLCHWHSACLEELKASDDLTLIPELGRAKRDAMVLEIPTVSYLAETDVSRFSKGKDKTVFKGIGAESLIKFQNRAKLLAGNDASAYITAPFSLPYADIEIFFDIEVDPMRDLCYLHGFMERRASDINTEKYIYFFTNEVSAAEEERAFKEAWLYTRIGRSIFQCVIGHGEAHLPPPAYHVLVLL